jgi:peptide-methionine (S)-S-oxide reductase
MQNQIDRVGFGGSCHWCTEAIFQTIKGVVKVDQGWIASEGEASGFSEAIVVFYNVNRISLPELIAIHLATHSCTSTHSLRHKYRSAIYTFNTEQELVAKSALEELQPEYDDKIITTVIPFKEFRLNTAEYLNYYYADPVKPFCQNIVDPKLRLLINRFPDLVEADKIK